MSQPIVGGFSVSGVSALRQPELHLPRPIIPSVAFVGESRNQIHHIVDIARHLENACLILAKKKENLIFAADRNALMKAGIPMVVWQRERFAELDGLFDVIVFQGPHSQMEVFRKSRFVMIQTGYVPAAQNDANPAAKASLCLVYGGYAVPNLGLECPVKIIGNPTLDKWNDIGFRESIRTRYAGRVDASRKTVLYAPASPITPTAIEHLNEILTLIPEYNIVIRADRNEDSMKDLLSRATRNGASALKKDDGTLEALALADVLISDRFDMIFDAVHCDVPVVFSGARKHLTESDCERGGPKFIASRLGPDIQGTRDLRGALKPIFEDRHYDAADIRAIKDLLALPGFGAARRAADALQNFAIVKSI